MTHVSDFLHLSKKTGDDDNNKHNRNLRDKAVDRGHLIPDFDKLVAKECKIVKTFKMTYTKTVKTFTN